MLMKVALAGISFLGLHYDYLIFSIHLMYVCAQFETLEKVFVALQITSREVASTVLLAFCVQYCFLVLGFLTFSDGYGFADMPRADVRASYSACSHTWTTDSARDQCGVRQI